MTIHIEKLEITAIIGILDFERIQPQKIVVDALINYQYKENQFINYVELIHLIERMIIEKKYHLLEDALSDIENKLIEQYNQIEGLKLKISKPDIIKNANVALSLEWLSSNSDT
jgi:dihydroneopterin aldolase